MRQLKKSQYAFFVKKENGNYISYSSLSGSAIRFSDQKYIEMLEAILNQDIIEYEDNDFFETLLKHRILIDESIDEKLSVRMLYEEKVIRSNLLDIMLVVTRECNFRCVYCGQPHISQRMDFETYEAVLKFVKNQILLHNYKKVRVSFFGGEPLLEVDNICIFLEKLRDMLNCLSTEENTIEYEAGMSTNGYLLTPQNFEKLTDLKCVFYQISIDGMPEVHDKMRPLVSGKGTWQRIIDNISYMIKSEKLFNITLRTNFNSDVAESLLLFYEFVGLNFKDERINIYYETIKNQGNEFTPEILTGIEEVVFDIDIAGIVKSNNLRCGNATSRLLPSGWVCYASKPNFFVFDSKNQILKCSHVLDSDSNVIGKLHQDGTFDFYETTYQKWVYNDYLFIEKCQKCKALPLCFGKRCPNSLISYGNVGCNVDMVEVEIEGLLNSYF